MAVSLRDGRRLWSQPLRLGYPPFSMIEIGDLHGTGRLTVVLLDQHFAANMGELQVRVFDGRDGKPDWTWKSRAEVLNHRPSMVLARLDPAGPPCVCVNFNASFNARKSWCLMTGARSDHVAQAPERTPIFGRRLI